MVLLPSLLADLRGYPVATVGLLLTPRGVGLMFAMLVLGRVGGRIDPRLSLAFGFCAIGISSWAMTGWNLDVGAMDIAWTGIVQGLGAGAIVIPLGALTFATLDPAHRTEAASMWNLVRSAGSSLGISLAVFIVARLSGVSRAGLVEHVSPYSRAFAYPDSAGIWDFGSVRSLALLSREIDRQSLMIGYLDVFFVSAWMAFLALPLILLLTRAKQKQ